MTGRTVAVVVILAGFAKLAAALVRRPAAAVPGLSAPRLDLTVPSLDANLGISGFASLAGTTIGDALNQAAAYLGASQPRGVRNNNPGNVKRGPDQWRGLAPAAEQTDPVFWRFTSPAYGIRVVAYLLKVYQRRGQRTPRQLISGPGGWAPVGVDGNPDGYAEFVADALGVTVDTPVDLVGNAAQLRRAVVAIIEFENSGYRYPDATVAEGIALA